MPPRERAAILGGLAGVAAVAWIYLIAIAAGMGGMVDAGMPQLRPWTLTDGLLTFVMWAVMMVAMMVPSAAPMVLLFAAVQRGQRERAAPVPTWFFLAGYLAAWSAFSAVATAAQGGLHQAALLNQGMAATSPVVGGGVLLVAGIYQWTPAKASCLVHCRSPLHFLADNWAPGRAGAFRMGWAHGVFCLGCCWALMALLFVAGVMNLLWVGAIAAFVLVEKLAPRGDLVGKAAGLVLAGWGALVLLRG